MLLLVSANDNISAATTTIFQILCKQNISLDLFRITEIFDGFQGGIFTHVGLDDLANSANTLQVM